MQDEGEGGGGQSYTAALTGCVHARRLRSAYGFDPAHQDAARQTSPARVSRKRCPSLIFLRAAACDAPENHVQWRIGRAPASHTVSRRKEFLVTSVAWIFGPELFFLSFSITAI